MKKIIPSKSLFYRIAFSIKRCRVCPHGLRGEFGFPCWTVEQARDVIRDSHKTPTWKTAKLWILDDKGKVVQ